MRLNPRISRLENFRDPGIWESRDPGIAIAMYNAGADTNPNANHDPTTNPDPTLTLSVTLIINLTLTLSVV